MKSRPLKLLLLLMAAALLVIALGVGLLIRSIRTDRLLFQFTAQPGTPTPVTVWIEGEQVGTTPFLIGLDELLELSNATFLPPSLPPDDWGVHESVEDLSIGFAFDCWIQRARDAGPAGRVYLLQENMHGADRRGALRVKLQSADGVELRVVSYDEDPHGLIDLFVRRYFIALEYSEGDPGAH